MTIAELLRRNILSLIILNTKMGVVVCDDFEHIVISEFVLLISIQKII